MDNITLEEDVLRDHLTVMVDSSDTLRRSERSIEDVAEIVELEPYSRAESALAYSARLALALDSYHDGAAVIGDELLSMAKKLTDLATQVTAVDEDVHARVRLITDSTVPVNSVDLVSAAPVGPPPGTPIYAAWSDSSVTAELSDSSVTAELFDSSVATLRHTLAPDTETSA